MSRIEEVWRIGRTNSGQHRSDEKKRSANAAFRCYTTCGIFESFITPISLDEPT